MEGDIELPYICVYIGIYSSVYMRIYRYVYRYYGSFNRTVEGDIELPSIDADKTLAVEFRYDTYRYIYRYIRTFTDEYIPIYSIYRLEADMGTERKEACVQCALLYTAADGTRHRYKPIYTDISRYI